MSLFNPEVDRELAALAQPQDAEKARRRELINREIRAICPRGLEHIADQCIRAGLEVEAARDRLLKAHNNFEQVSDAELAHSLGC